MKNLMVEAGFTEQGIEKFISTVESVLPHVPGNWNFISIEKKLDFIQKNKTTIERYINDAKPVFTNEENALPFNFDDDKIEAKNKKYAEIRSAEQTLRMF